MSLRNFVLWSSQSCSRWVGSIILCLLRRRDVKVLVIISKFSLVLWMPKLSFFWTKWSWFAIWFCPFFGYLLSRSPWIILAWKLACWLKMPQRYVILKRVLSFIRFYQKLFILGVKSFFAVLAQSLLVTFAIWSVSQRLMLWRCLSIGVNLILSVSKVSILASVWPIT